MYFSELLNSLTADGPHCSLTVADDWLQGRATFGGLVAAVGNEAMRQLVPRDRPLRSLQTTFVGPASAGAWRISARVLRVGKAVTLAHCEVLDGDQVAAVQVGVYGAAAHRWSASSRRSLRRRGSVEDINEVRFQPGRTPPFLQHFAVRWAQGAKPFSGDALAVQSVHPSS